MLRVSYLPPDKHFMWYKLSRLLINVDYIQTNTPNYKGGPLFLSGHKVYDISMWGVGCVCERVRVGGGIHNALTERGRV